MRFIVGVFVGLLPLGGYWGYLQWQADKNPCGNICGEGTGCSQGRCIAVAPGKTRPRVRRRSRRRRRVTPPPGALKQPSAVQRADQTLGPSLKGADHLDMAEAADGRELSEQEVEQAFRKQDRRILACIEQARGEYDIKGRVTVGFRIERSGKIEKVQVSAPRLMQSAGLHSCITPLVRQLSFGSSSRSLIYRFPYTLD